MSAPPFHASSSLVRAAWLAAAALACTLFVASLPGYLRGFMINPAVVASPQALALFKWINGLTSLAAALLSLSLAALLYWRKPHERMAVFISFYLLVYGIVMAGPLEALQALYRWREDVSILIQTPVLTTPTIALLALFPNGRFYPRWTKWLTWGSVLIVGSAMFVPVREWWKMTNPFIQVDALLLALVLLGATGAQVHRYRRISTPIERQQTKWVIYALLLWMIYLAFSPIPYTYVQSREPGTAAPDWALPVSATWWLSMTLLPLSLTVAILRRRLFDIDVLIRRTLIYSTLTALLALFYFGAVVLLQQLFRGLTGQGQDLAIIVSTLGIAALSVPVRNRVQRAIDRRFYRRKYDAAKVMAAFAATARDEVDLNRLTDNLMTVVDETMRPASVSVWVKRTATGGNNGDRRESRGERRGAEE